MKHNFYKIVMMFLATFFLTGALFAQTVPPAPVIGAASAPTTSGFTANWGASAGATSYRLDVATDAGFTSFVTGYNNLNVNNVITYAVTGLTTGTPYYYRVRAYNTNGTSGNSAVAKDFKDGYNSTSLKSLPVSTMVGATCETAEPFCTDAGDTYPAGVNTGTAQAGPAYGCLSTLPNPAWYYMKILTGGPIQITETNSANVDIDFILWGPFPSQNVCGQLTADKIVDCSYHPQATEIIDIPNSTAGEYYIMLVTNFSNSPTNITLAKTGGTGTTDCGIITPPAVYLTATGGTTTYSGSNIVIDAGVTTFNAPPGGHTGALVSME